MLLSIVYVASTVVFFVVDGVVVAWDFTSANTFDDSLGSKIAFSEGYSLKNLF